MDGLESDKDSFNEYLIKLICINKGISKMQKELLTLYDIKELLLTSLEEQQSSERFTTFLQQIR